MMSTLWSDQEIEIVKKMFMAKKSPKEIAKVLICRSSCAIERKLYSLGLFYSDNPEIDMDAYKQIMEET